MEGREGEWDAGRAWTRDKGEDIGRIMQGAESERLTGRTDERTREELQGEL